jgi:hypothetical protein
MMDAPDPQSLAASLATRVQRRDFASSLRPPEQDKFILNHPASAPYFDFGRTKRGHFDL